LPEKSDIEVFVSKRDKWATVLVWGIASLIWLFTYGIIISAGPFIERLIGILITFVLGLIAPWFWFTTKYRITSTSLHIQTGAFHKELKLSEIREVTDKVPVRSLSFAFSRDALQIEVEGSPRGYQISPLNQTGFMTALARQCKHLEYRENALVPPSDD